MSAPGIRVAVTGAGGRLGSAICRALSNAPFAAETLAWDVPDHDLDDPASAERLISADRPDLVIHCAAWTDVDGCATQPDVALRRNGAATGELALACVDASADLIVISSNEVFDGERRDGRGYEPDDEPQPVNPYGASKLAGERAAQDAFRRSGRSGGTGRRGAPRLAIVRTSWLFGRGAPDFPHKILAAAGRAAAAHEPLRVVADEWSTPTYAADLAAAIVELASLAARRDAESERVFTRIHHLVNAGVASRADWARDVLARAGVDVETVDVPAALWARPSRPPRWGVLHPTPLPSRSTRDWREAMAEYVAELRAELATEVAAR